jgi:WD40 repeat protein
MSWPLSHEFNEAIQSPLAVFADADLRAGETVVGATGLPLPRSGNFADVYQVRGADGREWAVKCFTRPVAGLADRYARVSEALGKAGLPFVVGFTFLAEGIRVGGVWRPAVKMEWVEGLQLNQAVRESAAKPGTLAALGQMWGKLCKRLREAGIAHADIQHGNVLLVPGTRPGAYGLKLIDYDGMWVSALANTPSGESGHAAYQHPARTARAYSPDLDRFPHLVIATALRGLAVGGAALWEKYDNGDNLLFAEADFRKPAASAVMKELWRTGDPAVQALVGRLALACGKPIPQTPWLDQLAPDGEPTPLDDATRRAAADALGVAPPVAVPPPEELPPEPALREVEVEAIEEVVDVDLVEEPPPERQAGAATRSPRDRRAERADRSAESERYTPPAQRGGGRLLLVLAGVLLLLGGGLTAVVLARKKPPEVVQVRPDETKPPETSEETPVPKAKDAPPPDREPGPTGTPAQPEAPGEGPELKPKWVTQTPVYHEHLYLPSAGKTVVAWARGSGVGCVLDAATGTPRAWEADLFKDRPAAAFPLTGGRLATWQPGIERWDEATGQRLGKLVVPQVPAPARGGQPILNVSPDARYVAAGWTRTDGRVEADLEVRVFDTVAVKTVVKRDWTGGRIHFTANSSRVLIAEAGGRCRWFKLPGGEADGEWDFGAAGPRRHEVTCASDDGSVLGYVGPLGEKDGLVAATLDGRTGAVVHRFGRGASSTRPRVAVTAVTGDGARVLVSRARPEKREGRDYEVADARTGAAVGRAPAGDSDAAAALSRDGTTLALAVKEPTPAVRMYDLPADSPAPDALTDLKVRWSAGKKEGIGRGNVAVDCDGRVLAVATPGTSWSLAAFDLKTGAPIRTLPNRRANFGQMYPLANGRFAVVDSGREVTVWDTATGTTATYPVVLPKEKGSKALAVSPNGRYVAPASFRPIPVGTAPPDTPLVVTDTTTGLPTLSLGRNVGATAFTADSARVLVVEETGRFRWFKLPGGEPDGEWTFAADGFNARNLTVSADGGTVLYHGRAPKATASTYHLLDGRTGAVRYSFPVNRYQRSTALLSDDGRHVLLGYRSASGHTAEILDARGAPVTRLTIPKSSGNDARFTSAGRPPRWCCTTAAASRSSCTTSRTSSRRPIRPRPTCRS